jgi:hypothetical protein
VHSNFACRDVGVHLKLTSLPPIGPEPSLIGRNRQRWPQFKHPVVAFGDLDLRAWLV